MKATEYNAITEIPDEVLDCLSKDDLLAVIKHFRTRHQRMSKYTDPETHKPITVLEKTTVVFPTSE